MFCKNCGNVISPGEKFCRKCGTSVVEEFNNKMYTKEIPNEQLEKKSKSNREFRIENRSGFWTGSVLLLIFSIIIGLLLATNTLMLFLLPTILITLILTINEKNIYLSDYAIVYFLKMLYWGLLLIFEAVSIYNAYEYGMMYNTKIYDFSTVIILGCFVLLFLISAISYYTFIQMNKTRQKSYKRIFVMMSFIDCGISFLLIPNTLFQVLALFSFSSYFIYLLFSSSLLLRALSISNEPEKNYISLAEPADGKHILPKSIGLSVFLSVITLGLYEFFIWSRAIILSIRKLEGKNNVRLGEWLCFIFIFPYRWYWFYTRYGKLSVIAGNNKVRCNGGGGIFIFLDILQLSVVNMAMIQSTLNQLAVVMRSGDFVFGTVIKTPEPVVAVQSTPTISNADELMKYKNLLDAGVITQEEFENVKRKMLR